MNTKLFIWQAATSVLLYLLTSGPVVSQENMDGFWKFSHVKVTETKTNSKGDKFDGISQPGIASDDETIANFTASLGGMTYNYSWAVPSWFEGQFIYVADFTWSEIPEVLIPGKEYTISVNAQMTECIRKSTIMNRPYGGEMGVELTISNTLYSSVNVESNIQMEGGFDYADDSTIAVYSKEEEISAKIVKPIVVNSDKAQYRFTPAKANPSGTGWKTINGEVQEVFSNIEDEEYAIMIVGKCLRTNCYRHLLYVYKWEPGLPGNNIVSESDKENETEYAIKVSPLTSDIKPDGKTTVQISAQLYSYTPGDNSSSKPVAGKPLSIEINDLDRIKPGMLSATSAITDDNGMVTFTYTAPTSETLEQMELMNRLGTTIKISNEELKVEDLAYISFVTDKGKIWVEPGMTIQSDTGFVPPDKRFPALISANFYEGNLEPIRNTDVTFSIRENNPVGMLRSLDGREGKQITLKTDASGAASVQYYYAASTPPDKRITETIEAKTTNMSIPFKAYVSTGFNIVIDDAKSGYENKGDINAGEVIPLKITVMDAWNPGFNLEEMMNHWGFGGNTGNNKLNVKLEIEKQGFVPGYLLDLMGEKNFPEPLYEELLRPKNMGEFKNLLYIPEYSVNEAGFPLVKPMFSGVNNYEIRVSLTDEKGSTIFESPNPRRYAFLSIPTGVPADAFSVWFAANPLGPHTELSRFARMLLSTISFGEYGGFGSILSLVDAAFAINSGDAEALTGVMLSEIKGKVFGDASEKKGLTGEIVGTYSNMTMAEQYITFGLTSYSDLGLMTQMENKVLSGIASAGFGSDTKMVVLKGDGTQKLFCTEEPDANSILSQALKDNFKIKITGLDKKTTDFLEKITKKKKNAGIEIPVEEGKYVRDEKLNTISLKNGKVSIYVVPDEMNVTSENAVISSY